MRCIRPTRALLPALALLAASVPARSPADSLQPAAGRFLVAAREQQGLFTRSVILLIDYGANGALGLIVNRPTAFPLAKLLPDEHDLQDREDVVYFGGPVSLDHVTLLVRSREPPPGALHVTGDVYASGSMTVLRAAAGGRLPGARFRSYAGYAGWGPGQLDSEITRGGWLVVPANPDEIFAEDPASLWEDLIRMQGTEVVRLGERETARKRLGRSGKY